MIKRLAGLAALLLLLLASLTLLLLPVEAASPADTHCVNPGGTGGCVNKIQTAIDAASPGDTVFVQAGHYHEHITITKRLLLYGEGWDNDKTVIDGQWISNTSVISVGQGITSGTVISGLQVTRGHNGAGGCIGMVNASPVIRNTWVKDCRADYGGGVHVNGGAPVFDNVPAWLNVATERGGGFAIIGQAQVTMTGVLTDGTNGTLLANTAKSGGAVYVNYAGLTMHGLRMAGNSATVQGGAIYVDHAYHRVLVRRSFLGAMTVLGTPVGGNTAAGAGGGGLSAYDATDLRLESVWFEGNVSAQIGGGARLYAVRGQIRDSAFVDNQAVVDGGGLVVVSSPGLVTVAGNWFEGNTAGGGGGLSVYGGSHALIDANGFFSNTASVGGGIALYQSGPVTVTNNILARNVAIEIPAQGAGLRILETGLQLVNNTIHDNNGDGVWIGDVPDGSDSRVANNIITLNTGSGIELYYNNAFPGFYFHNNDVFFNQENYTNLAQGGNLDVDPRFKGSGPNLAARLHLRPDSPVRAAGSTQFAPPLDVDGDPRGLLGSASMGADEVLYRSYLPLARRQ